MRKALIEVPPTDDTQDAASDQHDECLCSETGKERPLDERPPENKGIEHDGPRENEEGSEEKEPHH